MGLEHNVTNAVCDGAGCDTRVAMRDAKTGEIPEGWYRVNLEGEAHRKSGEWIFHSLACISKWAQERRRALGEVREIHRPIVPVVPVDAEVESEVGVNGHKSPTLLEIKRQQYADNQGLVLLAFEGQQELTVRQVAKSIGVSDNTARDHVAALLQEGKLRIVRRGTPHNQHDPRTYALVGD